MNQLPTSDRGGFFTVRPHQGKQKIFVRRRSAYHRWYYHKPVYRYEIIDAIECPVQPGIFSLFLGYVQAPYISKF